MCKVSRGGEKGERVGVRRREGEQNCRGWCCHLLKGGHHGYTSSIGTTDYAVGVLETKFDNGWVYCGVCAARGRERGREGGREGGREEEEERERRGGRQKGKREGGRRGREEGGREGGEGGRRGREGGSKEEREGGREGKREGGRGREEVVS